MPVILSIGAWLGLSSLFVSLGFFFLNGIPKYFFVMDLFLLGICFVPIFLWKGEGGEQPNANRVLAASFATLLTLQLLTFLFQSFREPHGGWDAWAVWNMHARFLFRGGLYWSDYFNPLMREYNPDYPLLIPATIAKFWNYLGKETTWVPALTAFFFTFGTVGLLYFALKRMQNKNQAFLAGIVLLGIPFFLEVGGSQIADVPISFYILATFSLLTFYDLSQEKKKSFLIFAGLFAGLAAWTKNEGLLFLTALCLSRIAFKRGIREFFLFGIGLAGPLALLCYFKMEWSPPSRFLVDPGFVIVDRLLDFSRTVQIAEAFYKQLGDRIWNWFPLFLVFYALVVGVQIEKRWKQSIAIFLGTVLIMFAGYFFIYLIAPLELTSYLQTSLNRLLLQLFPAFLLFYFLVVPVPPFLISYDPDLRIK